MAVKDYGVEVRIKVPNPAKPSRQDELLYIAKVLAIAVLVLAVAVAVLGGGAGLLAVVLRMLGA